MIRAEARPHGHDVSPVPAQTTPAMPCSAKSVGLGSRLACASCGTANQLGAKFCKKCGQRLERTPGRAGDAGPAIRLT